jgi:hypothetical protein
MRSVSISRTRSWRSTTTSTGSLKDKSLLE